MAIRRRKRPPQKIEFSFDSFLDLVANVVGIILRLILVAWAGSRSYKGLPVSAELPALPATTLSVATTEYENQAVVAQTEVDSLQGRLKAMQLEMAKLLEKSGLLEKDAIEIKEKEKALAVAMADLAALDSKGSGSLANDEVLVFKDRASREKEIKELSAQIEELRKAPTLRKTHRWKTPVSQTLQSDEIIFECRNGRVTGVDLAPMLDEIQGKLKEKGEQLRFQWTVEDETSPHGSFRLKYAIEREKSALEQFGGAKPSDQTSFRYGLASWEVIPVDKQRGETLEEALKPASKFRAIIDRLDPSQTAITFCVYPDSFALYREIRDFLHEKDIVVAGRPLPYEAPIAMNARKGSASRGQ